MEKGKTSQWMKPYQLDQGNFFEEMVFVRFFEKDWCCLLIIIKFFVCETVLLLRSERKFPNVQLFCSFWLFARHYLRINFQEMPIFIEYVLDRGIIWIFLTFNFKILTELNFVLHGFFIFLVGIKSVWYFFVAEQTSLSNIVINN